MLLQEIMLTFKCNEVMAIIHPQKYFFPMSNHVSEIVSIIYVCHAANAAIYRFKVRETGFFTGDYIFF